jgi:hypothetical protein
MNLTERRYTMVSYGSDFGPAAGSCEHDRTWGIHKRKFDYITDYLFVNTIKIQIHNDLYNYILLPSPQVKLQLLIRPIQPAKLSPLIPEGI